MHHRIAVATCANMPLADLLDAPFLQACERHGLAAERVPWDSDIDWSRFDGCLVRSTWDWHHHPERFIAWLKTTSSVTRLWNDLELCLLSLDKRYLRLLASRGVPTVPSEFVSHEHRADIWPVSQRRHWPVCVVKPTLGASAYLAAVLRSNADATEWAASHQDFGGEVVIQPYLPTIETWGELSLVYIGGRYSHAVRKRPRSGDFRVQYEVGGTNSLMDCPRQEREAADMCMAALPRPPMYARIDLVRSVAGEPMVLECELVEPELFFGLMPSAADRLAVEIKQALAKEKA